MAFGDRSVGTNVDQGLNCLASTTWIASSQFCRVAYIDSSMTLFRTYTQRDKDAGIVPIEIQFDGGLYRPNWIYFNRYQGGWQDMVRDFINIDVPYYYAQGYRVISFQFSYLNVMSGSNIDEKFFDRNFTGYNIVDLEQMETQYPNVVFVYWTTSLARTVGSQDSYNFNQKMREYAALNNKPLFDMADIESHDRSGNECVLNSFPIICREYTTESTGGHLGSISDGMLRMGEGMWLLMAQIAGWTP